LRYAKVFRPAARPPGGLAFRRPAGRASRPASAGRRTSGIGGFAAERTEDPRIFRE